MATQEKGQPQGLPQRKGCPNNDSNDKNKAMKYDPLKHHRHSIRLKGYDYSSEGLYFLTLCCQDRVCLFGEIKNGEMILNDAGKMIENEWIKLPARFKNIKLHEYVIMPNHFHSIIEIVGASLVGAPGRNEQGIASPERATTRVAPTRVAPTGIAPTGIAPTEEITSTPTNKTVGDIMDAFKSITTVEYIRGVKTYNWLAFNKRLWQRNYWEHIIRNQEAHEKISGYILNNSAKWEDDSLNNSSKTIIVN